MDRSANVVSVETDRVSRRRPARAPCVAPDLVRRANVVLRCLAERGATIVSAESCTAGLIASAFSQADGAADVLHGGFVAYTKAQKSRALGVSKRVLDRLGSVNKTVALELAKGALERSTADLAIAVTGVLGPEPDEDGNPVGLVYLCCRHAKGHTHHLRLHPKKAPHDQLRARAIIAAFDLVEATLENLPRRSDRRRLNGATTAPKSGR
jgi:nicotinamide-nucleotide amidase